ncbi:hypothetical protein FRB90_000197 [Tulasnella sp. 427]|nr:hypothetical protein FRB90_000197 [Tulasnella sp. 427]
MATHICVAPSDLVQCLSAVTTSPDATGQRFLRLPHPRTNAPSLFLAPDQPGASTSKTASSTILEVQSISPDASRSWFTSDDQVVGDGKLVVFTPIDPLFLLLPIMSTIAPTNSATPAQFRPLEDIFEDAANKLSQSSSEQHPEGIASEDVLFFGRLGCVVDAMRRLCDVKEITEDIIVYRFSQSVLLPQLQAKVARLSDPVAFGSFRSLARGLAKDGLGVEAGAEKEGLRELARTKGACETLSQYLPAEVYEALLASYDFTALDAHLKALAAADDSASAVITQGKENVDESGAKAKAKDAKGGKKGGKGGAGSRGIQQLAKANVQGMAKLSSFFTKKDKAAA